MSFYQTKFFSNKDFKEKTLIWSISIIPSEPLFSKIMELKNESTNHYQTGTME